MDAKCPDHLTVLRGRSDQHAKPGSCEQKPQQAKHERAQDHQNQVIGREASPQNINRTGQTGRSGSEQIFGAPHPEGRVLDHQNQCKSRQELK